MRRRAKHDLSSSCRVRVPVAQSSSHVFKNAIFDQRATLARNTFSVKGSRPQSTPPQRIVDDRHAVFDRCVRRVCRAGNSFAARSEAPLMALTRWPMSELATRVSKMTGTRWVEVLRGLARLIARSPALLPIASGGHQISLVMRDRIVVVALHAGAFTDDRHGADRMAGAEKCALEAVAGGEDHAAHASRRRSAAGFAHALDAECGALGRERPGFELGHAREGGIEKVEIGDVLGEQRGVGETRVRIFRCNARHGDGTLRRDSRACRGAHRCSKPPLGGGR